MKGKTNIFLTSFLQFSCLLFLKSALKDCQCSTISKNNFCSQNQVQMSCSCSQLHKRAERIGCMLMEKGKFNPGDHVALVFPPGRQWTGTACKKKQNQTSFTVMWWSHDDWWNLLACVGIEVCRLCVGAFCVSALVGTSLCSHMSVPAVAMYYSCKINKTLIFLAGVDLIAAFYGCLYVGKWIIKRRGETKYLHTYWYYTYESLFILLQILLREFQ